MLRSVVSLWVLCLAAVAGAADRLPALNVDIRETSLSGLSSGAFMAVQFHLAHASIVRGVGILAGGPWGCAQGDWARALGECMKGEPAIGPLVDRARSAAEAGDLDPSESLVRSRIWLFSGYNDGVVRPSVMNALQRFYRTLAPGAPLMYRRDLRAGHAMVTESAGADCPVTGGNFVTDCDYDAAGNLLQFVHGRLDPPAGMLTGRLTRFDQSGFTSGSTRSVSMAAEGYLFVPKACEQGERCRVHVALHGCEQAAEKVGEAFVRDAGYNRWADTNRIVVLYPQTRSTWGMPWNPYGCWDWWGYTGAAYATKRGAQVSAIRAMVDRLVSGARGTGRDTTVTPLPPALIERSEDSAVIAWRTPTAPGVFEIRGVPPSGPTVVARVAANAGAAVLGPLAPATDYRIVVAATPPVAFDLRTAPSPPACDPWFGTNVDHVTAGRAYVLWGRTYASGTHQDMGWWNIFTANAMHRVSSGYALGPCG